MILKMVNCYIAILCTLINQVQKNMSFFTVTVLILTHQYNMQTNKNICQLLQASLACCWNINDITEIREEEGLGPHNESEYKKWFGLENKGVCHI